MTTIALTLAAAPLVHAAEDTPFSVRVRAIRIDPADRSDAIGAIGAPKDTIDVETKWAPDIDLEYAFNPRLALELLLTIPQKHEVVARRTALGNDVPLGSVSHLPPTLTLKYYLATQTVRPYVGAGLNVTWFTDDSLAVPGVGSLGIDRWSFGPAVQAGVDVQLSGPWSLSIDAKRAWIRTDVDLAGTRLTTVKVDPWIIGVGVGYRL